MVALVVIFWLTIGGILELALQYQNIRAEVSRMDIAKLRSGFQTLDAMMVLADAIDIAAREGMLEETERRRIRAQVENLLQHSKRFNATNAGDDAPHVLAVRKAFVDVLEIGETALARDTVDIQALDLRASQAIFRAKRALLIYFDEIHSEEIAATRAQNRALSLVTLSAAFLLLVFFSIAFGAVMLFRSELSARLRQQAAERRARFLAYFDPLTELANRTMFHDIAETQLAREEPLLIALLDLDEFKSVNDTLGHAAGDQLLKVVATRISEVVSGVGGTAARLGGDEFAAILPHLGSRARVEAVCDALMSRIREPVEIDGNILTPSASIGLSGLMHPTDEPANALSSLLHQADFAMYASKRDGRGRYTLFDQSIWQAYNARRMVRDALPEALENDNFFLLYQPQVDLASGRVFGLEAFVRWRHEGQVLEPSTFLPIAEESGIVLKIDEFVLRQATRQAVQWNKVASEPISVSVNLSSVHFQNDEVVHRVAEALAHSGLEPNLLTLEMTETVLIDDWKRVSIILAQLHTLGVRIALDDFGTGYSSIGYLRQLDVDEVKIDKGFVSEVETSGETRFLLDAVTDIARGLNMRILVEGLETAAQLAIVKGFGCAAGQGFYFSRLLTVHEIDSRLAATGRILVTPSGLKSVDAGSEHSAAGSGP